MRGGGGLDSLQIYGGLGQKEGGGGLDSLQIYGGLGQKEGVVFLRWRVDRLIPHWALCEFLLTHVFTML